MADHAHPVPIQEKAKPLELFFDLVFVFAITQVTGLLAADPTWIGFGRGLAVLALLWWAWVGYSWLSTAVDPEEGWVRVGFIAAMAAMFVAALATDGALGNEAMAFAVSYAVVRVMQVVLLLGVAWSEPPFRRAVLSLAPSFVVGPALLIVAAAASGPVRGALWAAALVIDFGGPLLGGSAGWRLSPAHFAERHGLILIIALGEAIVSVGVASEGRPLDTPMVLVALLTILLTAAMWWTYFDVVALVGEQRLHALTGKDRNALARDSYSYLHLLLVSGTVLVALGIKKLGADPTKELTTVPSVALAGGVGLYLLGHVLFRLRNVRTVNRQRTVGAVALFGLAAAAPALPGLVVLAVATAIMWAVVAYEAVYFRDLRHEIRHHGAHAAANDPASPLRRS